MKISNWVKSARDHAKLTQTQLGEPMGLTKGNVSAWEKGRHEPSFDQLKRIAEITSYPEPLPGMGSRFDANALPASIGARRIPLLNYVQAGMFTDMGSNFPTEDMEYLLTDLALSNRAFALQIKGESMLPEFKEGDRIIVDCDVCPRPGDFVVAKNTTEEATFKKYRLVQVDANGQEVFELIPLNDDYPTVRSDQQHLHIIGTMVEHRKYFRR